jgi:hypothetical protein
MSKMEKIKIFFDRKFKTTKTEYDFEKFKQNCLNEFNLNENEINYYKFYIIKDNERENITNQEEYYNLIYNAINIECVYFERNEDEEDDIEINNNDDENITLKNELEKLYSILNYYQEELDKIEKESKIFLELEVESKKKLLNYKTETENKLNNLENKLISLNNNSKKIEKIMISENDNDNNQNEEQYFQNENNLDNINKNYNNNNENLNENLNNIKENEKQKNIKDIDSNQNYSCIFIFEKKSFEVELLNIDKLITINFKIKNNGNRVIPQNWNIKQFSENRSIFKIKEIEFKNEIKVNEEILIKMELEIKDKNNINFGINSLQFVLIHRNIGQISKKEVIEINIKK